MKRDDCGDKSVCLYQRLCSAKLNIGNGCDGGKVYTCGKTRMCLKDAIKCADAWMAKYPVGCNVKEERQGWAEHLRRLRHPRRTLQRSLRPVPSPSGRGGKHLAYD